jgi:hypothetical protein
LADHQGGRPGHPVRPRSGDRHSRASLPGDRLHRRGRRDPGDRGAAARRLETGAAFHEPAGARILRFDNASREEPLEFVATYLLQGDQPLIEMLE